MSSLYLVSTTFDGLYDDVITLFWLLSEPAEAYKIWSGERTVVVHLCVKYTYTYHLGNSGELPEIKKMPSFSVVCMEVNCLLLLNCQTHRS